MLQIIQDTREQHPFSFEGYPVEVKPGALPTGDYSLDGFEDRIVIERKAAGDLLSCMTGGRERFGNWNGSGDMRPPPWWWKPPLIIWSMEATAAKSTRKP